MPRRKHSETTLDSLAQMMAKGFEWVATRFDEIDRKLDALDQGLKKTNAGLTAVDKTLREFKTETRRSLQDLEERAFSSPHEREDLEGRVSYIEKKLGIQSGK